MNMNVQVQKSRATTAVFIRWDGIALVSRNADVFRARWLLVLCRLKKRTGRWRLWPSWRSQTVQQKWNPETKRENIRDLRMKIGEGEKRRGNVLMVVVISLKTPRNIRFMQLQADAKKRKHSIFYEACCEMQEKQWQLCSNVFDKNTAQLQRG